MKHRSCFAIPLGELKFKFANGNKIKKPFNHPRSLYWSRPIQQNHFQADLIWCDSTFKNLARLLLRTFVELSIFKERILVLYFPSIPFDQKAWFHNVTKASSFCVFWRARYSIVQYSTGVWWWWKVCPVTLPPSLFVYGLLYHILTVIPASVLRITVWVLTQPRALYGQL